MTIVNLKENYSLDGTKIRYLNFLVTWISVGFFLVCSARMRIPLCGFRAPAPELCLQFQPTHIIASRGKINNLVDFGKASSSLHSNLEELLGTLIFILRQAFLWNTISSKMLGKHLWVVLKFNNHLSSRSNYGTTTTNPNHLLVFQGLPCEFESGQ